MLHYVYNTTHHPPVNQLIQAYNYECAVETILQKLLKNIQTPAHKMEILLWIDGICSPSHLHMSPLSLTHPDFPKLSRSELLLQLQGLSGNLPLVLPPGLLWCPRLTRLHQLCAQPVCLAWTTKRVGGVKYRCNEDPRPRTFISALSEPHAREWCWTSSFSELKEILAVM